jgi:hypothetical protein
VGQAAPHLFARDGQHPDNLAPFKIARYLGDADGQQAFAVVKQGLDGPVIGGEVAVTVRLKSSVCGFPPG